MAKLSRLLSIALLPIMCVYMAPSWSRMLPNEEHVDLAGIVQHAAPAVVVVDVVKHPNLTPFHPQPIQETPPPHTPGIQDLSVGSGVIFNAKLGYIVTNAHVINNAKLIIVRLKNGESYIGHIKGIDKGFDIAIVQIHATHLSELQFADSDHLKVGNSVVALGSPFGLNQTLTSGVVSALNVSAPKIEGFQNFIQTDAPINPGNSGGPLLNMQGKVVGINTALLGPGANIGIGYSIPSNMVQSVITQLLKYGQVERGMLGVITQQMTPRLATALHLSQLQGTIVADVLPNTPAAKAGLKLKDVIEKLNGKQIKSPIQLKNMLGLMRPGTVLKIQLSRQNKPMTLSAIVGSPNAPYMQKTTPFLAGLKLQNFKQLEPNTQYTQGVLVVDAEPTSQAALDGIEPGDIIVNAQDRPIHNISELKTIADQSSQQLLLRVKRNHLNGFVVIEHPIP